MKKYAACKILKVAIVTSNVLETYKPDGLIRFGYESSARSFNFCHCTFSGRLPVRATVSADLVQTHRGKYPELRGTFTIHRRNVSTTVLDSGEGERERTTSPSPPPPNTAFSSRISPGSRTVSFFFKTRFRYACYTPSKCKSATNHSSTTRCTNVRITRPTVRITDHNPSNTRTKRCPRENSKKTPCTRSVFHENRFRKSGRRGGDLSVSLPPNRDRARVHSQIGLDDGKTRIRSYSN